MRWMQGLAGVTAVLVMWLGGCRDERGGAVVVASSARAEPAATTDAKNDDAQPATPGVSGESAVNESKGSDAKRAQVVFGGGCFWCVEAVFEELEGVDDAESGYAGGTPETANYKDVCNGNTGHAEAVRITFDPTVISYHDLLKVHFATHDPTTKNRQGADVGPQYRSAIFYANEAEKKEAEAFIKELADAKAFGSKAIVTTLEPLEKFYPAEQYHQNYACQNLSNPYIEGVAWPKVKKVREKFADKVKDESPMGR